eukprot:COSAG02_NODE_39916_length_411_cov_0.817308_1_plen_45_part_01
MGAPAGGCIPQWLDGVGPATCCGRREHDCLPHAAFYAVSAATIGI